ncbi:MAG: hypothetical protein P1V34_08325 [Alphaproteobacteria bacterium]|nr:hypothetical protein [Alphaproteobacteria bacterium]
MPKFRTHFELDIKDIDFIEVSLTKRVGDLTRRVLTADESKGQDEPKSAELMQEIQQIRGLLGKIHEQKIWYDPKEYHPRG